MMATRRGIASSVNTAVSLADYTVVGKLTYNSGAQQLGLLGRSSSNGKTTYGVQLRNNQAQLFKTINGAKTLLGKTIAIDSMAAGKSYIVRLTLKGSTLQMAVDGVTGARVTD